MVNCCIIRKLQNLPQNGNTKIYDTKPARHAGNLFDSISSEHERQSKSSKFQSMLERFVDGGLSESAIDVSFFFFYDVRSRVVNLFIRTLSLLSHQI